MNVSPHAPRLTRLLALALSLTAIAALAMLGGQGIAQARKSACSSVRAHGSSHGCAGSGKARHKARKHHHAKKHKSKAKAKHAPAVSKIPATCEDGSEPTRESDGSFVCGDGSEPECEDGSTPALSPGGSKLQCTVAAATAEAEAECEELECTAVSEEPTNASCTDGSSPASLNGSQFFCSDGSAPSCEDGSSPSASGESIAPVCDGAEDED